MTAHLFSYEELLGPELKRVRKYCLVHADDVFDGMKKLKKQFPYKQTLDFRNETIY